MKCYVWDLFQNNIEAMWDIAEKELSQSWLLKLGDGYIGICYIVLVLYVFEVFL